MLRRIITPLKYRTRSPSPRRCGECSPGAVAFAHTGSGSSTRPEPPPSSSTPMVPATSSNSSGSTRRRSGSCRALIDPLRSLPRPPSSLRQEERAGGPFTPDTGVGPIRRHELPTQGARNRSWRSSGGCPRNGSSGCRSSGTASTRSSSGRRPTSVWPTAVIPRARSDPRTPTSRPTSSSTRLYDPCSLVVLESLACGLPVITTK